MKRFKALAFGTFSSNDKNRGILYIDPNHADEEHHSPRLSALDEAYARERGLIGDQIGEADDDFTADNANTLSAVNIARQGAVSNIERRIEGSDVVDASRQTTAWSDPDRVLGGAHGYTDGNRPNDVGSPPADDKLPADDDVVDEDADDDTSDDDAPAAPVAKKSRQARTKAAE